MEDSSVHVPLWPWNRHRHRCVDCGFLSIDTAPTDLRIWTREPVAAGVAVQIIDHPACFVNAYDLNTEALANPPRLDPTAVAQWRLDYSKRVGETTAKVRTCSAFFRLKGGYSGQGHLNLKERHEERRTAIWASMIGGVIAGTFTVIAAVVSILLTRT